MTWITFEPFIKLFNRGLQGDKFYLSIALLNINEAYFDISKIENGNNLLGSKM